MFLLAFLWCMSGAVNAQAVPVYVEGGVGDGQGLLFRSTVNSCYGVTPKHVVGGAGASASLTDQTGYVSKSFVKAADDSLDMALLDFADQNVQSQNPMFNQRISLQRCGDVRDLSEIVADSELEARYLRARVFGTRIAARAGGLQLIPMRISNISNGTLTLEPANQSAVIQSDSGMPVWSITDTAPNAANPDLLERARLVGFVRGVSPQGVDAVSAETASEMVYNALAPIDPNKVISPSQYGLVTRIDRGHAAWTAYRVARGDERDPPVLHDFEKLSSFSVQFDLGDRDNLFKGISLRYLGRRRPEIRYYVSENRPGANSQWELINCRPDPSTMRSFDYTVCVPRENRIVRGVWVDIRMPPDAISNLTVLRDEL